MNRRVKDFYLNEIERYIQYLKKLTPQQVEQLREDDASIEFVFQGNKFDRSIVVTPENKEYVTILESMEELQSKSEVEQYLKQFNLKRKDLETMCRLKDIPFTKRDNMTTLKDKLFERLVGFRLRSRAIQNDGQ
ncbi:MAG: hypothetical protein J6O49_06680 [Bacteroidaceae bacterium]|nr:hypothetical protein [Bacteroidaceae bacterium]